MPRTSIKAALQTYLQQRFGLSVELASVAPLKTGEEGSLKGYGYGVPLLLTVKHGKRIQKWVLETMSPGPFGHEHFADRAQAMLWDFESYARLPKHVRAVDVGAFTHQGSMQSVAEAEEFFVITEWSAGRSYHHDLEQMASQDKLTRLDRNRIRALATYLAGIHAKKKREPDLYRRRLRELLGHGECIMGLTDSYPIGRRGLSFITPARLRAIEDATNRWRWAMRQQSDRLSQVHGDFHPFNVLFRKGTDFRVIDRSRGEWGEPADDLTALSINYLFFSLQRHRSLTGALHRAFIQFWEDYQLASVDREITRFAAPFFAFRGLVVAHPLWYPKLRPELRETLLRFVENVLAEERFEPTEVTRYLALRQPNDRG